MRIVEGRGAGDRRGGCVGTRSGCVQASKLLFCIAKAKRLVGVESAFEPRVDAFGDVIAQFAWSLEIF